MTSGPNDQLPRYIPCNKEFVVPTNVRPKFNDVISVGETIVFSALSSDPTAAAYQKIGSLYYNGITGGYKYYNGSVWKSLSSTTGGGSIASYQDINSVANQTITSGASTLVKYSTLVSGTLTGYSSSTGNLVIPSDGVYDIRAQLSWAANTNAGDQGEPLGVTIIPAAFTKYGSAFTNMTATSNNVVTVAVNTGPIFCNASDTFSINAINLSAHNLNVLSGSASQLIITAL